MLSNELADLKQSYRWLSSRNKDLFLVWLFKTHPSRYELAMLCTSLKKFYKGGKRASKKI